MNKFYNIRSQLCRDMKNVLDKYHIPYEEITDVEQIVNDGILSVPTLKWEDGETDNFKTITQRLNEEEHDF